MDAQYKEFQSRSKQLNLNDDHIPMSREEEATFMQTFRHTRFDNDYRDRDSNRDGANNFGHDMSFNMPAVRIKSLLDAVRITDAQVCVNTAQLE
uniref:Reverse transcriptase domain-containing protein n=1 Tax=Tanacetum cinerariifolium TaxID=118510 RepID=A0A699GWP6_TANCI|nr:hypothetical protein [Tanacetum cinerariifolium]